MLIASSEPWIVFYHEGYLRRSLALLAQIKDRRVYLTNTHFQSMRKGFKLSEHIWTFAMLQEYLDEHSMASPHYVESILNPYLKAAAEYVFESARSKLTARKGTFHVIGLDFMIDDEWKVHFIKPMVTLDSHGALTLTRGAW